MRLEKQQQQYVSVVLRYLQFAHLMLNINAIL